MVIVAPGLENKDMNAKRDNIHFTSSNKSSSPEETRKDADRTSVSPKTRMGPHTILITKSETGFGFNVRGQIGEGGPMKSINGKISLAPLEYGGLHFRFDTIYKISRFIILIRIY